MLWAMAILVPERCVKVLRPRFWKYPYAAQMRVRSLLYVSTRKTSVD